MGESKRAKEGWLKYWDFILIDAVCLDISLVFAHFFRFRYFFTWSSRNAYRTSAFVLVALSVIISFVFKTMNNVLTRSFWEEIRKTLFHCCIVFLGIVVILFTAKDSDRVSRIVMCLTMAIYFVCGIATRLLYKRIISKHKNTTATQSMPSEDFDKGVWGAQAERANCSEAAEHILPKDDGKSETLVVNQSKVYRFLKRFLDILLSMIALVVLSPVFLITALAIWLEDGEPFIFSQIRSGINGTEFEMYKFRSMVKNAPELHKELLKHNELDGPAFKMKDDPRITKVGKFIRRTSIDELPQLVNIIKGDMSIVGPRPLPVYEQEQCNEYQNQRLLVKPGLTCYWQVMGRNGIDFDDWIELDLKYIKNASFLTDMGIIFMTFGAVLSGKGAE